LFGYTLHASVLYSIYFVTKIVTIPEYNGEVGIEGFGSSKQAFFSFLPLIAVYAVYFGTFQHRCRLLWLKFYDAFLRVSGPLFPEIPLRNYKNMIIY
jgi:hypothetical protein